MLIKGGCVFRFVYPSGGWGQHKYQCNLMPHPSWSKTARQEFLILKFNCQISNFNHYFDSQDLFFKFLQLKFGHIGSTLIVI